MVTLTRMGVPGIRCPRLNHFEDQGILRVDTDRRLAGLLLVTDSAGAKSRTCAAQDDSPFIFQAFASFAYVDTA